MKISEVEELLGVSRANIRYYEKEGLINVKREPNRYRDYNDEDIARLKKVLILRKLGISIEEIRAVLSGEEELQPIILRNIQRLKSEIEQLRGALEISNMLADEKVQTTAFDEEFYWDLINRKEKSGGKFKDILKDYLPIQKAMLDSMLKALTGMSLKEASRKGGKLFEVSA